MTESASTPAHQTGDRVTIRWPGGPYDFVIRFDYAEPANQDGWLLVRGLVVEPEGPQHRTTRAFYVRPVEPGVYTLLPMLKP